MEIGLPTLNTTKVLVVETYGLMHVTQKKWLTQVKEGIWQSSVVKKAVVS